MALTDHDLSELLAALKAGEMTDTIRMSLEWILQQLIEAEATAVLVADWRSEYNGYRPHSALGMLTPTEFARAHRNAHTPTPSRTSREPYTAISRTVQPPTQPT